MNLKITLDVPEEEAHLRVIRKIGRMLLEHHECAAEEADDLELILGELCSNVIRHARSEEGRYCLDLECHEDHVVLVVVDRGVGFDSDKVLPMGTARPDKDHAERYGGFGLHLVRDLADHVDIRPSQPKGTVVRVLKRLRRTDAPAFTHGGQSSAP